MARLAVDELPQRAIRWFSLTLWLLAAAAALTLIVRTHDLLQTPFAVFPAYYGAAKLIERGEKIANFYDDQWFMRAAAEFEPTKLEIYNVNTPLMGFFFLPLTRLSYDSARSLMSALGFAALVIAAYLMALELGITGFWRAAAFFVVFAAPTSLLNLITAQVYPLILLILAFAWLAWRRHAEVRGGMLIGIVLAFKTAGLFLLPLMMLERRWQAALSAAGVVILATVITFPFVQIEGWAAYLNYGLALADSPGLSHRYWSVAGLSRNFFTYDELWNRDPYFDAPGFAFAVEALLSVTIFAAAAKVALVTKDRDVTFALFTLVSLILVPLTSSTHLCVAFLPAFILFSRLKDRLMSPLGGWFIIGGVLSFAPGVDRLITLADWGGPLFLYPRLYGLLILMILLIMLGREHKRPTLPVPQSRAIPG